MVNTLSPHNYYSFQNIFRCFSVSVFARYSWRRSQHVKYGKRFRVLLMLLFTQFLATRAAVGPLLIRITHITSPFLNEEVRGGRVTSSKVQGLSVGSWETARWKFQALIETPVGSESRQTISKWFDKYQLVIGHKKNPLYYCAQSANSTAWVTSVCLLLALSPVFENFSLAVTPEQTVSKYVSNYSKNPHIRT